MDQVKIGKFIAECRRKQNLTQMQLAEKLNITDRAISKWENGRSMPDSSIMLELCDVLEITVNDLLNGEVVTVENKNRETENKLLELVKENEQKSKHLLMLEWVIGIMSCIIMFVPIFAAAFLPMSDLLRIVLVLSGFILGFIGFHFAIKIEQTAGYYQCRHCDHRYIPTLNAVYMAPHFGRTRYMLCPKCGKKSWQKKVISKER